MRLVRASASWSAVVLPFYYPQVWAAFRPIPTGLRPPAQGCEPASYPGCWRPGRFNPNGVVALRPAHGHNPVGVGRMMAGFPRVARSSQPWALGRNPVGIQRISPGLVGNRKGGPPLARDPDALEPREASWSAPALWRFGRGARNRARSKAVEDHCWLLISVKVNQTSTEASQHATQTPAKHLKCLPHEAVATFQTHYPLLCELAECVQVRRWPNSSTEHLPLPQHQGASLMRVSSGRAKTKNQ